MMWMLEHLSIHASYATARGGFLINVFEWGHIVNGTPLCPGLGQITFDSLTLV
jgi:hypothetical protein